MGRMNYSKIIVHRANSFIANQKPIDRLSELVDKGLSKLEVDITITGKSLFEFCHPSQLNEASSEYPFNSPLFEQLAELSDDALWLIDIKYLDENIPPTDLIKIIHMALGARAIFSASLPQLLVAAHDEGARTAHFFRDGVAKDIGFEPDYFIYRAVDHVGHPLDRTIMYCRTLEEAEGYVSKGVAYVMIDASLLER